MRVVLYDPYHSAVGPEWTLWAAGALFLLVLTLSVLLTLHFNRRDARIRASIRAAVEKFQRVRATFMGLVADFQSGKYKSLAVFKVVLAQGVNSLEEFEKAKMLAPELEADADWLNSLQWVEKTYAQLEVHGGL